MLAATRDGGTSPALEQFRRVRRGAEAAIPARPAPASGGLRGRLETAVGTRRVTPREVPSGAGAEESLVPAVDRETQLARLRSVRASSAEQSPGVDAPPHAPTKGPARRRGPLPRAVSRGARGSAAPPRRPRAR
ncbi:hypothetical protein [Brachybacterium sp. GPGPB12]|uniref:hypothetical protein n=1 Tax=Brachybacterium sp. GPGPB12 TaxID=3023517 RepID=UPI00313424DE